VFAAAALGLASFDGRCGERDGNWHSEMVRFVSSFSANVDTAKDEDSPSTQPDDGVSSVVGDHTVRSDHILRSSNALDEPVEVPATPPPAVAKPKPKPKPKRKASVIKRAADKANKAPATKRKKPNAGGVFTVPAVPKPRAPRKQNPVKADKTIEAGKRVVPKPSSNAGVASKVPVQKSPVNPVRSWEDSTQSTTAGDPNGANHQSRPTTQGQPSADPQPGSQSQPGSQAIPGTLAQAHALNPNATSTPGSTKTASPASKNGAGGRSPLNSSRTVAPIDLSRTK
jgi:hypothetical protein